jgi:mRNA interferase YafQ
LRTTSRTSRFKRDIKRLRGRQHSKSLQQVLAEVVELLLAGVPLPQRYKDHALTGTYRDCRECHLKPDLLLIYAERDGDLLELTRIGSHSELFE